MEEILLQIRSYLDNQQLPDYYSFPENIITFAYSKKGSKLKILELDGATWFLRLEKHQAILIHWCGEISYTTYKMGLSQLQNSGITRFGSLPSFKKLPSEISSTKDKVWMSYKSWENSDIKSKTKRRIRNNLRKFEFHYIPKTDEGISQALKVLDEWYEIAKTKYFIPVYGHYFSVINHHPLFKNSIILGAYPKDKDEICGIIGGYINPESNTAVLVLAKHNYSYYTQLGDALWGEWFNHIHDEVGISCCNNGDTADGIKQKFGLTPLDVYKIPRKEIIK